MRNSARQSGSGLLNALLLLAIFIFFAKFVLKIIPDPIDETTLFSTFITVITALAGIMLTWLRHDLNKIHDNLEAINKDVGSMKTDIAVIKERTKNLP